MPAADGTAGDEAAVICHSCRGMRISAEEKAAAEGWELPLCAERRKTFFRKCIGKKCRGGRWPPGRICCEFAGAIVRIGNILLLGEQSSLLHSILSDVQNNFIYSLRRKSQSAAIKNKCPLDAIEMRKLYAYKGQVKFQ